MATITQPQPGTKPLIPTPVDAETRILLHNIPWQVYEALRGDEANYRVRMTYDDGSLELMCPSQRHEGCATWFTLFLVEIAAVLGFPCMSLRSTTWRKEEGAKGKEADDCFYLASFPRVKGKTIDLKVDPPPDLAVEVEISQSAIDCLTIYGSLGVPEVWRFDGQSLHIHVRQADGTYVESELSPSLPYLRPDEVIRWMHRAEEVGDNASWKEEVRAWAHAELLPRYRPA